MTSMEVALSLAVTFTICVSAFLLGRLACHNLYQVIANLVGFPYL
jgi:hypothetical protein